MDDQARQASCEDCKIILIPVQRKSRLTSTYVFVFIYFLIGLGLVILGGYIALASGLLPAMALTSTMIIVGMLMLLLSAIINLNEVNETALICPQCGQEHFTLK